mmetsp:Transcript_17970/g.68129  ORF Transcript_17970/g.68129 Transcript_17970/m.68129 type:complete len:210 (-) Transcript_17970:436-1065(-)
MWRRLWSLSLLVMIMSLRAAGGFRLLRRPRTARWRRFVSSEESEALFYGQIEDTTRRYDTLLCIIRSLFSWGRAKRVKLEDRALQLAGSRGDRPEVVSMGLSASAEDPRGALYTGGRCLRRRHAGGFVPSCLCVQRRGWQVSQQQPKHLGSGTDGAGIVRHRFPGSQRETRGYAGRRRGVGGKSAVGDFPPEISLPGWSERGGARRDGR